MEVIGKYGIRAKVLKKSKSSVTGIEFVTYEIEYPRIILAELNTHGMTSRNSASSRAIPFLKMLEQLNGRPVRFGQSNPGMQDKGEDFDAQLGAGYSPEGWWDLAKLSAINFSREFYEAGYHKQVYNRLTEPFQMMKTVISATEWANFFWLRNHDAADPTLQELARVMKEAYDGTEAETLQPGEWHLPYVDTWRDDFDQLWYGDRADDGEVTIYALDDAIKISCARSAAVSFRNEDYGLGKSKEVYERLVGDARKHASAFEHAGTPMQRKDYEAYINLPQYPSTWEPGVSHMDRNCNLWSGKLKGWVCKRKLIPGENYTGTY